MRDFADELNYDVLWDPWEDGEEIVTVVALRAILDSKDPT